MATDINDVIVIGRLTRDSELRYTSAGMAVLSFSIANGRTRKTGNGWEKEVSFFNISCFGKQAEGLSHYMVKGQQICCKGFLKQKKWTTQDGQVHSAVEICAENIQLLGGSGKQQDNTNGFVEKNSDVNNYELPMDDQIEF